jgi:diadenosine tetraphosphate (Ap4A) HIT family hydrolase
MDKENCLACDLINGRTVLPGGLIARKNGWVVEHCVGPLGVGSLIVKPERHVERVAELTADEATAMGPMLHEAARVVTAITEPDQVYICLWSHAGGRPGHIHYVVQPITQETMERHDAFGPELQVAMFEFGEMPERVPVEEFAQHARGEWRG